MWNVDSSQQGQNECFADKLLLAKLASHVCSSMQVYGVGTYTESFISYFLGEVFEIALAELKVFNVLTKNICSFIIWQVIVISNSYS